LSSSSSPGGALIKPTEHIAYPDIKVGIPSLLLAIEMTMFAIIHIFAFSWKPYDVTKNADPSLRYEGGTFGWKALWDAFNLWDVVKAAARGFRWLFHGRKFREGDISYGNSRQPKYANEDTSYGGASQRYTAGNEQELGTFGGVDERQWNGGRPSTHRTASGDSDDQQGLLSHAQGLPLTAHYAGNGALAR
jgi:hypothetical protein